MVDYQRRRAAIKRGGDLVRDSLACAGEAEAFDALEVVHLLDALEAADPRKADLVRLRVFLGATMEEAAEALAISLSSAERDWRFIRRWMATRLAPAATGSDDEAAASP
jgi:DNA-directed RNA polymerase specialized sigma24 family protein